MEASIRAQAPGLPSGRPSRKAGLALACASALVLGACLQTDPGSPNPDTTTVTPPEDNGRRAGASSSTNWPNDFSGKRTRIQWSADTSLRIFFHEGVPVPPFLTPTKVKGSLQFYRGGVIPAFESLTPKEMEFGPADTLTISAHFLDSLWQSKGDTLSFNVLIKTDTMQAWLMGFSYSKSIGRVVDSPLPNQSGEPPFLQYPRYFFTGNLKVDTTLQTPAGGKSEFCFYIPGTPIFGKVQADNQFKIGPLPKGEYPLRLLRLTPVGEKPGETLVEVWEAPVDQLIFDSSMTPGAKVLTVRTQGILNLRNAE